MLSEHPSLHKRVSDAVGLAAELREPPVVDDVACHGRRHLVVPEDRAPPGELQVGREYDRLRLLGLGDHPEERPGPVGVERQEAKLVYDTQRYEVDGIPKEFDFMVFRAAFDAKLRRDKLKKTELEERLARAACAEASTVHNWRGRRNSPSSLDIIHLVAAFLEVTPEDLLTNHKEQAVEKLTDSQRNAVANVY